MTAAPEPSLSEVLAALTATNEKLDSLIGAVIDLAHATNKGFEGLGREVAGVDACVAKLQVTLRQAGNTVADAAPSEPTPEPSVEPAETAPQSRPRRSRRQDVG